MARLFSKAYFFLCLAIGIAAVTGCSMHERSDLPAQQKPIQRHDGTLFVRIVPDAPTSSDDLQAVCTQGGTVAWTWEKNGQILDNENTPRLSKSRFTKGDTVTVTVKAGGREGKAYVAIANSPPEVRSVRLTPDSICKGVDITAVPEGFDADGDEIKYSFKWFVNGEETNEETAVLKGTRIKKGDTVSVQVTPYDPDTTGKAFKTRAITIPKAAPCFISTPPATFRGSVYTYDVVAKDPDGGPITYYLASSPPGMAIDSRTGKITWTIDGDSAGPHAIEVVAQDNEGTKTPQKYTLTISLPGAAKD